MFRCQNNRPMTKQTHGWFAFFVGERLLGHATKLQLILLRVPQPQKHRKNPWTALTCNYINRSKFMWGGQDSNRMWETNSLLEGIKRYLVLAWEVGILYDPVVLEQDHQASPVQPCVSRSDLMVISRGSCWASQSSGNPVYRDEALKSNQKE